MKPIRVLIDNATMDRGGAEAFIMNVYRNLDRTKVQFDFLLHCDYKSAYEEEIEALGGVVFKLPAYKIYNATSYRKALSAFFEAHPEYRIIHSHLMNSSAITLDIANKHGLHTIAHSHASSNGFGPGAWIRDFTHRNLYRIAEYRFACSEKAGKWLYRGMAPFTVVKNGINSTLFDYSLDNRLEIRKEFGIQPDTVVLGTVGRLSKEKNQSFLLELFANYKKTNQNSILIITGDGPLLTQLKAKASQLGVMDSVIFSGVRTDVEKILCAMDIFILPSQYEGFPVTLVEAQCTGLPCLISDAITSEVKLTDLITENSLSDSIEEWISSINEVLKLPRKGRSDEIQKAGYDIKTTAGELERFYLSLT